MRKTAVEKIERTKKGETGTSEDTKHERREAGQGWGEKEKEPQKGGFLSFSALLVDTSEFHSAAVENPRVPQFIAARLARKPSRGAWQSALEGFEGLGSYAACEAAGKKMRRVSSSREPFGSSFLPELS